MPRQASSGSRPGKRRNQSSRRGQEQRRRDAGHRPGAARPCRRPRRPGDRPPPAGRARRRARPSRPAPSVASGSKDPSLGSGPGSSLGPGVGIGGPSSSSVGCWPFSSSDSVPASDRRGSSRPPGTRPRPRRARRSCPPGTAPRRCPARAGTPPRSARAPPASGASRPWSWRTAGRSRPRCCSRQSDTVWPGWQAVSVAYRNVGILAQEVLDRLGQPIRVTLVLGQRRRAARSPP